MSPVHPVFWRENIVGSVRAWGWSWKRHTPEATEFATLAYVIKSNNYRHIITMISKIIVVVSQNSCWTKWKYWTYWKCCWNRHGMCHASIAYYVMNAGKHDWCTAYCSSKITQVVILYDCVFALSPEWHPCSQLLLDASYFDDECITAVKQE